MIQFWKRRTFIESWCAGSEDGKEGSGDGYRTRKITLGRREGLGSSGRVKEEESEVDKDWCTWEEDDHGRPAVVEGEGEMYPELVVQ